MSRIRSKDTKPELVVRRLCHSLGYRFRLHRKDLPGKPDLVLPKYKIALFVNGCFWHRCPHCELPLPKTNSEFCSNLGEEINAGSSYLHVKKIDLRF